MLHTAFLLCAGLEKNGWKIFKVAKNEINMIFVMITSTKVYGCKTFLCYKDVDKFCNSLAELYSNVSKVGDLNSVNTFIMNKLYLNTPLRAAAGSYIYFFEEKVFYDGSV